MSGADLRGQPAEGYRVFHHTEHLWTDLHLLYHAIQRQHPVGLWLELSGIGHLSPTPEWGSMLNALRQQIYINPLITIIPGLFIFVTA